MNKKLSCGFIMQTPRSPTSLGREMTRSTLAIKELQKQLWIGRINLVLGKKESGKTTLCLNLLRQIIEEKSIDKLLIVGNKDDYPSWATVYDSDNFDDVGKYVLDPENINIRKLLIIDSENFYSNLFDKLFINNRSYNMTIIITRQIYSSLSSSLCRNIDYVFLLPETNLSTIQSWYNNFGGIISTFDMFKSALKSMNSSSPTSLVIKHSGISCELTQNIFWTGMKLFDPNSLAPVDSIIPLNDSKKDVVTKKQIIQKINSIKAELDSIINSLDDIAE